MNILHIMKIIYNFIYKKQMTLNIEVNKVCVVFFKVHFIPNNTLKKYT